jgi:hypothetical protein
MAEMWRNGYAMKIERDARVCIVTNFSEIESAYLYMHMAVSLGSFGSTIIFRNELLGTPRHLGVKIALCSRRRSAGAPVSARGFSDCLGPKITSVPIYTDARGNRR